MSVGEESGAAPLGLGWRGMGEHGVLAAVAVGEPLQQVLQELHVHDVGVAPLAVALPAAAAAAQERVRLFVGQGGGRGVRPKFPQQPPGCVGPGQAGHRPGQALNVQLLPVDGRGQGAVKSQPRSHQSFARPFLQQRHFKQRVGNGGGGGGGGAGVALRSTPGPRRAEGRRGGGGAAHAADGAAVAGVIVHLVLAVRAGHGAGDLAEGLEVDGALGRQVAARHRLAVLRHGLLKLHLVGALTLLLAATHKGQIRVRRPNKDYRDDKMNACTLLCINIFD